MQGMEVSVVSPAPKMLCCQKMSEKMEIRSKIQRKKFALNFRRYGPQPSIFVRSFSAITIGVVVFAFSPQAEQTGSKPPKWP